MNQEKSVQKQNDLVALETFVVQGCNEEDKGSDLLKQLCCRYPYYFIQLMKKHGRLQVAADASLLTKCFLVAVHVTDAHYKKLQRFLVQPPKKEQEQNEFDRAVEVLEVMILKQAKDN